MNTLNPATEVRDRDDSSYKNDELCLALKRNVNSLYVLAFLLTASHVEAERCLEILIDETFEQRGIAKSSLSSYLRFRLIEVAISRRKRRAKSGKPTNEHWFRFGANANNDLGTTIDAVIQLSPLSRFVFVITVLERLSDKPCAALLGCSMAKVIRARELAFRRLQLRYDPAMAKHHDFPRPSQSIHPTLML